MMQLSVAKALQDKNPGLYKKIPSFVIRWVERLICQDEMNMLLREHGHLSSLGFTNAVIDYLDNELEIHHEENIPRSGRYIIASNHPLGGLDGMTLISVCGRYRQDIKFPVNDLLYYVEPMREIFVPINKHGRTGEGACKMFNEAFESDNLVLYFPAGLCSRKKKGVIQDLEWKKTIISRAKQTQRDIIPCYFGARNSNLFYNVANLREKLGVKSNLEMILLPREMMKKKKSHFEITFGEPISYHHFDDSKNDKEWAAWLKEKVYSLKK
jgi:putative hemolysin